MTVTQSVSGTVADAIEEDIRARHLPAGRRIGTKTELLQQFNVAPATLNEALRILRERRIVIVKPGPKGGIFVADQPPLSRLAMEIVDLKSQRKIDVNNAVEVLDGLDTQVMHDAVRCRTEQDVADLNAMREPLISQWHTPASEELNWQLHRRIADITPNLMLRSFYQNLVDYILAEGADPTLGVTGFVPDSDDRLKIHLALIDVIADRADDRVDAVLHDHRMVKA
ncbi:FadR/GntR family transcriptional regulator [Bifidobacterium miconisargentati]|uniref:FadR/GntR family transcriptional regulator n=1 Tax=Bifidobacterium miconisargentati TaxID=2834437 RepID=UPI001BDDA3DB|nr:GntR family transcriptional regulator [Bifidobacterium miconisargentati]MBW3090487.1 FadR family transcriptional regulator [Bifidobacterium miconisargentati]